MREKSWKTIRTGFTAYTKYADLIWQFTCRVLCTIIYLNCYIFCTEITQKRTGYFAPIYGSNPQILILNPFPRIQSYPINRKSGIFSSDNRVSTWRVFSLLTPFLMWLIRCNTSGIVYIVSNLNTVFTCKMDKISFHMKVYCACVLTNGQAGSRVCTAESYRARPRNEGTTKSSLDKFK